MIKKFTRVVLTVVMPISMIVGCGNTEKLKQKNRKRYNQRKRTIRIIRMEAKV